MRRFYQGAIFFRYKDSGDELIKGRREFKRILIDAIAGGERELRFGPKHHPDSQRVLFAGLDHGEQIWIKKTFHGIGLMQYVESIKDTIHNVNLDDLVDELLNEVEVLDESTRGYIQYLRATEVKKVDLSIDTVMLDQGEVFLLKLQPKVQQ